MSPTAAPLETRPPRQRRYSFEWWWVLIAVLAISLLAIVTPFLRGGSFVNHVNVPNSSPFDVDVAVTTAHGDGWMALGTAVNRHTLTIDEVYVQGSVWIFRFSTADRHVDIRM